MNPPPTSILAFRNGSIGNTLVAIPALRAIRQRHPAARLAVVVDPVGRELLRGCPWIDRLILYDRHGRDRSLSRWLRLVRKLRRLKPSHALLFKRFLRNGILARLSGAPVRIGFDTGGRAPCLNRTIPYDEGINITLLNLRLAALLDAGPGDPRTELWLSAADRERAGSFLAANGLEGRAFIAAHYGGTATPPGFATPERFAELLRRVGGDERPAVLLGSGASESEWASRVARALPVGATATGLPLRVTAAILGRASLFVGFNSGPAHLAVAAGSPALMLFRPDDRVEAEIRKWLPLSDRVRPLVPPRGPDAGSDWPAFFENAARAAAELAGPAAGPPADAGAAGRA